MPTTDNIEGENLGNIFHYQEHAIVVQSRWKAFLSFLEQHLDNSDYLLPLEKQLFQKHFGFLLLFLLWWKSRVICPPNQTSSLVRSFPRTLV